MNAPDLIAAFSAGQYTVIRRASGTYSTGRLVAGSATSLAIVASVQPATDRDLQRLPEGRRSLETRTLYTTTELRVGGQGTGSAPDLVTIDGASWEVQSVETWPNFTTMDAPAYRVIVQRPVP